MSLERLTARLFNARTARWFQLLAQFLSGQLLFQLLGAVTTLLLVRWLTLEEYAKYTVATGVQATFGTLVELGIGSAVVALAGREKFEIAALSRYIAGAHILRRRLFGLLAPLIALVVGAAARKEGWQIDETVVLIGTVLITIYLQGILGYLRIPFTAWRKVGKLYGYQNATILLRLGLIALAYPLQLLTATWALLALALFQMVELCLIRRELAPLTQVDESSDLRRKSSSEILDYLLPLLPAQIYWSLQGQIALLAITFLGTTSAIAEVGALGRLAQLFTLLGAFNIVFVAPFFAALDNSRLLKWFVLMMVLSTLVVIPLVIAGFFFPGPVLWLLGPRYAHLTEEVGYLVSLGCLSHVYGTLWTICSARRYQSWRTTQIFIGISLVFVVLGFFLFDLSTVRGALLYSILLVLGNLTAYTIIAAINLRRDIAGETQPSRAPTFHS